MSFGPSPIRNRGRWAVPLLFSAVLAGASGRALADGPGHRLGYALADQPAAPEYTPHPAYAYNSAGQPIEISRRDVGSYTVKFMGLGGMGLAGAQVQVTAFGAGTSFCKVHGWLSSGPDLVIRVRCYDIGPADSRYSIWVNWPAVAGRRLGYTWVAPDGSLAMSLPYSYNGGGGPITAARVALGRYTVRFAGLGGAVPGGNVQVTSYGPGFQACKTEGWSSAGADFFVAVRCLDPWGWPMDGAFDVLALWPEGLGGGGVRSGFAWAHNATAASYNPSATYAHNSAGGPITVTRSAPGRYSVRFAGLGGGLVAGGNVVITAYGNSGESCKVATWSSTGPDFVASVACIDGGRDPVDTRYSLLVTRVP
jgi:hypothetical protein